MWSSPDPYPLGQWLRNWKNITVIEASHQGVRGSEPHIQLPNLGNSCTGKRSPIISGFENQWGLCSGEPEGCRKQKGARYSETLQHRVNNLKEV